jgi:hypothetical protein
MSRPTAWSLRLDGLLARAFPDEFKNAYGAELLQDGFRCGVGDLGKHVGPGPSGRRACVACRSGTLGLNPMRIGPSTALRQE